MNKRRTEGGSHRPISGTSLEIYLGMRNFTSACPNLLSIADTLLPPPQCRTVTNDGRKVDPTERFRPPRWRLIRYENSRSCWAARAGEGSTLTPRYEAVCQVPTS